MVQLRPMLAVETELSFEYLSDIFRAPEKSDRRRQIDDDTLSFDQKWNNLAYNFMNADDFMPENIWAEKDSRLENIDPRVPPTTAWTGEQLRKTFRTLKSHFAKVDDMFHISGNLEAGADVADRFMGHVGRLLPDESDDLHKVMLFAFWAFDKHPPQFITRAKPQHQQFDSSDANNNGSSGKKRKKTTEGTEILSAAIASLAPDKKEQKHKVALLATQARGKSIKRKEICSVESVKNVKDI